jgi:pimeloyl-ACP methyl ester carboxylesterase
MIDWGREQHGVVAHGRLAYRDSFPPGHAEPGRGPAFVLLHGIGSGAPSWQGLAAALGPEVRTLAWDAPGYGGSDPLPMPRPSAQDFADVLGQWLGPLSLQRPLLVGHSLGAIVAARWAAQHGAGLRGLVLASPARGYGGGPSDEREARRRERIDAIERLGPQAMAEERAARLCRPGADPSLVAQVREIMLRVSVKGYVQAAHLLADGHLIADLAALPCPVTVVCGALDGITPPQACAQVAHAAGVPLRLLDGVGHACYLEDPSAFADVLRQAWDGGLEHPHDR